MGRGILKVCHNGILALTTLTSLTLMEGRGEWQYFEWSLGPGNMHADLKVVEEAWGSYIDLLSEYHAREASLIYGSVSGWYLILMVLEGLQGSRPRLPERLSAQGDRCREGETSALWRRLLREPGLRGFPW